MNHKVTWHRDASYAAVTDAVRRVFVRDGISRHVYFNDKIMKYDWELSTESLEDNLDGQELEEHIARLINEQTERKMGQD